jgi:hypothetical protein
MKRVCVVLVLVSVLAGGLAAQDGRWGGKKNFVSADLGLFDFGARYERFDIAPKVSVGAVAYWSSVFFFFNELELGVFGRYYPFDTGSWTHLFGELGLGLHTHTSFSVTGTVVSGVAISPGVGLKFDPGVPGGFFVEPGIIMPITIGAAVNAYDDNTFGMGVGVVARCSLGWAF